MRMPESTQSDMRTGGGAFLRRERGLWITGLVMMLLMGCSSATPPAAREASSEAAGELDGSEASGAWNKSTGTSEASASSGLSLDHFLSGREKEGIVPEYVFTYAENQTGDYPTTQAARRFAKLVNEQTDGRIEIRVYPNAELGDELSAAQQLSFGGIDFCRAALSSLTDYSAESIVLQMPYLYKDSEHMWRVLDGSIGDRVKASFQGSGLVPLAWLDAGVRNFYTVDAPIEKLDDMKGLKIRVQQSSLAADMVQCLGAVSVPIIYDAVKEALQTGEIDGAENNWPSYETMQHNDIARYFTLDEHMRVPELLLISQTTWDQLTEEDRQIIQSCASEAGRYERTLWTERESSAREKCLRNGTVEVTLSDKEKARFRSAVTPLYRKYCSEYTELIDEINALRDEKG